MPLGRWAPWGRAGLGTVPWCPDHTNCMVNVVQGLLWENVSFFPIVSPTEKVETGDLDFREPCLEFCGGWGLG